MGVGTKGRRKCGKFCNLWCHDNVNKIGAKWLSWHKPWPRLMQTSKIKTQKNFYVLSPLKSYKWSKKLLVKRKKEVDDKEIKIK